MLSSLSIRLGTLQSFHKNEPVIWDIGCDHGQLGLSFMNRPGVEEIHLVDPSNEVMTNLKKKLVDSDIPARVLITPHEMKGHQISLSQKPNIIFIAGMGGKEIEGILQGILPALKNEDRLVLSPHRKIRELRSFLIRSELGLESEQIVFENGQFYEILVLTKSSLRKTHPYGDEVWKGSVGKKYLEHVKTALFPHKDKASLALLDYLRDLSP